MIRVFVAADLSPKARRELGKIIRPLTLKRWPVRWERPEKLHFTLFFIGWAEEGSVQVVTEAVERGIADITPFSVRLGELGAFPDFAQPRVVWLGVKGDEPTLVRLRKRISAELVKVGFKDDKRVWTAHLTIGRVLRSANYRERKELGRQLRKLQRKEFQEVSNVSKVIVYQSTLSAAGSSYTKLSEASLTSRSEGKL